MVHAVVLIEGQYEGVVSCSSLSDTTEHLIVFHPPFFFFLSVTLLWLTAEK